MFQTKVFDYNVWPGARDSTSFNADFRAAYQRACMNGDISFLSEARPVVGYPAYPSSDLNYNFWGCMGEWFSGQWFDAGARSVTEMQHLHQPWPQSELALRSHAAQRKYRGWSGHNRDTTQLKSSGKPIHRWPILRFFAAIEFQMEY